MGFLANMFGKAARTVPAGKTPVLRCSICTGEQVAGFRDDTTGTFEEVRLIHGARELAAFLREYGLDDIRREY